MDINTKLNILGKALMAVIIALLCIFLFRESPSFRQETSQDIPLEKSDECLEALDLAETALTLKINSFVPRTLWKPNSEFQDEVLMKIGLQQRALEFQAEMFEKIALQQKALLGVITACNY